LIGSPRRNAARHLVESALPRELQQQLEHAGVEALAREVVSHAAALGGEAVLARRVCREADRRSAANPASWRARERFPRLASVRRLRIHGLYR
jgi:hypothetical protein